MEKITLNNKEYTFILSVGAVREISKICPDQDINKLALILDTNDFIKITDITMVMALAMNKYTDDAEKLTTKDLECLSLDEFNALQDKIIEIYVDDKKTEVEVTPSKKKDENEQVS